MTGKKNKTTTMGTKLRPPRTLTELRSASDHVIYEWTAVPGALHGLIEIQKPDPDMILMRARIPWAGTSFLESTVMHLRAVVCFAYPTEADRSKKDDILAEDFIPTWDAVRPSWPAVFERVRARVGTEVAHLSYRRVPLREADMKWPFGDLMSATLTVFDAFLKNVPRERVSENWKAALDTAQSGVPPKRLGGLPPGALPVPFPAWPVPKP